MTLCLVPKQFVSDAFPNALTKSDLKQYFGKIALLVRDKIENFETVQGSRKEIFTKIRVEVNLIIVDLLNCYGYHDLENDDIMYKLSDDDDDEKISIKIMILIFQYVTIYTKMVEELDTSSLLPFFSYIEECVCPNIVNYAKTIAEGSMAYNRELVYFQMNIEDMQNWEQLIMHFYTLLQIEFVTWGKQSIYEFGDKGCSPMSCFTLLAMLKYFSEKKDKFFRENNGQLWQKSEKEYRLLHSIVLFWSIFQEFMEKKLSEDGSDSEEEDDEIPSPKRLPHGIDSKVVNDIKFFYCKIFPYYMPLLVESIYNFSESPNSVDKSKDDLEVLAYSVMAFISGARPLSAKMLKSLVDQDYNQVKNLDNSAIISDIKSRNLGKFVWVIKQKVLNIIRIVLEELCTSDDYSLVIAKLEFALEFLFPYGDFIIETLKRVDGQKPDAVLRQIATLSSLSLSRIFLSGNEVKLFRLFTKCPAKYANFPRYISTFEKEVVEIWMGNLFSTDQILRENTCFSLSVYFTEIHEDRITHDLIEMVIKSCDANISNMSQYSTLLSALIDKMEYTDSPFVDEFRSLFSKLFEIICKDDKMKYLSQSNMTEEKKIEMHSLNNIFYFESLHDSYNYIKDGFQFDKILLHVKEKIEEIWNKKILKENIQRVNAYVVAIKEIARCTNLTALMRVFNEVNYFLFFTKLIRSCIALKENCTTIFIGPIYQLVGVLSNIGVLHLCPFDDKMPATSCTHQEDLIYDYLLPIVIDEALPPSSFFTEQIMIDESNLPKCIDSFKLSSWALGRIIYNDIIQNGGERSLCIFDRHVDRFIMVVKYLTSYDFYTTEEIRGFLIGYQDKILITGLCIIQTRMEKMAPHFAKIFGNLCQLALQEDIFEQELLMVVFSLLSLADYLMDFYPETEGLDEISVLFAPVLSVILPECNPYQRSEFKRIIAKISTFDEI